MYIGQDSDQKHLFSHTNSNSCDTFKRVAAQAVARDEGVLSNKSGLHTAPLVLQTASARPEAVCFELRHFCRRESVKTDANARRSEERRVGKESRAGWGEGGGRKSDGERSRGWER